MRIAVVHSFYSSAQPSGENTVVNAQVAALEQRGHNVRLIARRTDDLGGVGNVARSLVHAANGPGVSPVQELEAFQPDVVHVHNLFPNWSNRWLSQWGRRTIVTLHNFRPVCAAATLWRDGDDCTLCPDRGSWHAVKHKCYRNSAAATLPLAYASRDRGAHQPVLQHAARLVVLNEQAEAFYSTLAPGRVQRVANFVDPGDVSAVGGRTADWLYVGRLTPEKGVTRLIETFPRPEQLVIIGDGPEREAVEAAASARGVRFQGPLAHQDVLGRVASARGLILPSLWAEGIPTVTLEALATGTPLVVSQHCKAADELVAGGAAGRIYVPEKPESLQGALADVAAHWPSLSDGARRLHATAYSPEAWCAAIEPIYEQVAAGARTPVGTDA